MLKNSREPGASSGLTALCSCPPYERLDSASPAGEIQDGGAWLEGRSEGLVTAFSLSKRIYSVSGERRIRRRRWGLDQPLGTILFRASPPPSCFSFCRRRRRPKKKKEQDIEVLYAFRAYWRCQLPFLGLEIYRASLSERQPAAFANKSRRAFFTWDPPSWLWFHGACAEAFSPGHVASAGNSQVQTIFFFFCVLA